MVVLTQVLSHVVFTLLIRAVPLTPGPFEPPSSQPPFLQVDPAQLVVHSWIVQEVQSQEDHDEKAVNPHTDESSVVTKAKERMMMEVSGVAYALQGSKKGNRNNHIITRKNGYDFLL